MKRDQALSDAADAPKKSGHVWITSRRSAARFLCCASLALVVVVCLTSPCNNLLPGVTRLHAQEREARVAQRVLASDIGSGIEIVGLLGFPLGEVFTVQGKWSRWDASGRAVSTIKGGGLRFLIASVNGKRLEKPVDFRGTLVSPILRQGGLPDIRPASGDVWELRGIEIGSYRGVQGAVYKEVFRPRPGQMVPAMPLQFGFYTELRYFSRQILRQGEGEVEPEPESPSANAIREL